MLEGWSVKGALLEGKVGLQVDLGGGDVLVAEPEGDVDSGVQRGAGRSRPGCTGGIRG